MISASDIFGVRGCCLLFYHFVVLTDVVCEIPNGNVKIRFP
jgi:hypothetical protein